MNMQQKEVPMEIIDAFRWEERSKLITRDIHHVSGLMNFTYLKIIASEPATPLHYHTNTVEIHCIVKGRRHSRLYINDRIENSVYTGGEVFVIFPGEYHSTGNDSQQSPCEVLAIQLNVAEADDFLGLNQQKGRDLCDRLTGLRYRHLRMGSEELSLLKKAFVLFATNDVIDREEGLARLLCFLYRLVKLPPAHITPGTQKDINVQKAVNFINENINEPIRLDALAKLTGYSLSRFKTKFREETGQTPSFFISSAKIETAKKALLDGDRSITDVAYDLGWSSGNYFCTVFKKLTGISPLQYRKNNR